MRASAGVVAFLRGPSRGSVFPVREAIGAAKPAAVVLARGGAALPAFSGGPRTPCTIGSVAAFRWVPAPGSPEPDDAQPARGSPGWTGSSRCRKGSPPTPSLAHIASLSQGDRLWFQRGILVGDTVVVPHEALSGTPAFLATPRLMGRFRCTAGEAAGLVELFLALDAGPAVVVRDEAEARQRGAAAVSEDLAHLVARLALAEAVPDEGALEHADCLADSAVLVSTDGQVWWGFLGRMGPPDSRVRWGHGDHGCLACQAGKRQAGQCLKRITLMANCHALGQPLLNRCKV
ncbi:MAG: hypothetical protein HYS36_01815 [Candidatus Rokubacteria bacterium]|nr:hypothetical protein [Candidatus Rokubacteria bacterium]